MKLDVNKRSALYNSLIKLLLPLLSESKNGGSSFKSVNSMLINKNYPQNFNSFYSNNYPPIIVALLWIELFFSKSVL